MRLIAIAVLFLTVVASCNTPNNGIGKLHENNTTNPNYDPNHFANQDVQSKAPSAFALQREAKEFVYLTSGDNFVEEKALIGAIFKNKQLTTDVKRFPTLDWNAKKSVLEQVFQIEIATLGITAPELQFDSQAIRGPAFFDFDLASSGPGKVILNPTAIQAAENPYIGLLLLIHETRHSYQLQLSRKSSDAEGVGYAHAFRAQKEVTVKSFSDFLTLLNEYEAFRYANYVVGAITEWQVDTLGLGTYASQFDQGHPRIDLADLFRKEEAGQILSTVLEEFNKLENEQYIKMQN
ncbi:MAG: hypothetical protein AB7T49_06795 [Oligoflexales bacterium]